MPIRMMPAKDAFEDAAGVQDGAAAKGPEGNSHPSGDKPAGADPESSTGDPKAEPDPAVPDPAVPDPAVPVQEGVGGEKAAAADAAHATPDHAVQEHDAHATGSDGHAADGAHQATYLESDTFVQRLQKGKSHFLDPHHLFGHVQDATFFEVPKSFVGSGHIELPRYSSKALVNVGGTDILTGRITKFMVLELVAAILIFVTFYWLSRRVSSGVRPTGRVWNLLESIVVFVRDEIARPSIGEHDAKRFLPFLLTVFFFILMLNLFGMVPFLGSATGAIAVTSVIAVVTFGVVVGSGVKKMGLVEFLRSRAPHLDLPPLMATFLIPGIWLIEVFGLFIKHFVLAVRLFANMFAGHLVLAVFMAFIGVVSATWLVWGVAPMVIIAELCFSLLELFIAFLQAYVFTFLAALFIGEAQHAH